MHSVNAKLPLKHPTVLNLTTEKITNTNSTQLVTTSTKTGVPLKKQNQYLKGKWYYADFYVQTVIGHTRKKIYGDTHCLPHGKERQIIFGIFKILIS